MKRRDFIKSAASGLFLLGAPAIVRSESLMVLPPRKKVVTWWSYEDISFLGTDWEPPKFCVLSFMEEYIQGSTIHNHMFATKP